MEVRDNISEYNANKVENVPDTMWNMVRNSLAQ